MPFNKCTCGIYSAPAWCLTRCTVSFMIVAFFKYIFKGILKIRQGLFKLNPSSACLSVLAITRFVLWLCKWLCNKWAAVTKYQPLPFFSVFPLHHCLYGFWAFWPNVSKSSVKSNKITDALCLWSYLWPFKNTKSKGYEIGLYHSSIFFWRLTNYVLKLW